MKRPSSRPRQTRLSASHLSAIKRWNQILRGGHLEGVPPHPFTAPPHFIPDDSQQRQRNPFAGLCSLMYRLFAYKTDYHQGDVLLDIPLMFPHMDQEAKGLCLEQVIQLFSGDYPDLAKRHILQMLQRMQGQDLLTPQERLSCVGPLYTNLQKEQNSQLKGNFARCYAHFVPSLAQEKRLEAHKIFLQLLEGDGEEPKIAAAEALRTIIHSIPDEERCQAVEQVVDWVQKRKVHQRTVASDFWYGRTRHGLMKAWTGMWEALPPEALLQQSKIALQWLTEPEKDVKLNVVAALGNMFVHLVVHKTGGRYLVDENIPIHDVNEYLRYFDHAFALSYKKLSSLIGLHLSELPSIRDSIAKLSNETFSEIVLEHLDNGDPELAFFLDILQIARVYMTYYGLDALIQHPENLTHTDLLELLIAENLFEEAWKSARYKEELEDVLFE